VPESTGSRSLGGAAEAEPAGTRGPGRVLVAIYGLFTLAAGARAGVQLAVQYSEAPVAYVLSAVAALIYLSATIGLARGGRGGRLLATVACSVELAGVLAVGTLSLTDRAAFPDATVWSVYGKGYGFVPLALPVLGLLWLRHQAMTADEMTADETTADETTADEATADETAGEVSGEDAGPPPS
jgi:hypothetical protein